jgi:large subunit ribosomal protein L24
MKSKIKIGDQVVVIAGNDKGRTGEIKKVLRADQRVLVEGVNLRWRHKKPTQQSPKGERIREEIPIHVSNVMLLDATTGKGTRKRPAQES